MRTVFTKGGKDWHLPQNANQVLVKNYHILNEVVIDRGPNPSSVQLDIYLDGNYLTNLVGDGLIIATPTGSTAYNMSAGGSIVQTGTDAICLTPLAPHSLSFRPVILPISTNIMIKKPEDGRSTAWVSLDGSFRFELEDGEELAITTSTTKLGMVVEKTDNLMNAWVKRMNNGIHWNRRDKLKPMEKKEG